MSSTSWSARAYIAQRATAHEFPASTRQAANYGRPHCRDASTIDLYVSSPTNRVGINPPHPEVANAGRDPPAPRRRDSPKQFNARPRQTSRRLSTRNLIWIGAG